jgi:ABC-type Fe3+ transport system substrate-binding protein
VVDVYGFEFLERFAAQQPQYVCGDLQGLQLATLGAGNGSVATAGLAMFPFANDSAVQFAFPANNDPLTIATLYAAITQQTERPETARLYVNWLLEMENPVSHENKFF